MSDAISAHGTIIRRNSIPIGELRDITPPARTRNQFDVSTHNDDDDSIQVGIRRKGELQFLVNFLPQDTTHDHVSGIQQAYDDGSKDLYELEYPDGSGMLFSGFVTNFAPNAPVDGELSANVSVKPSGGHLYLTP